MLDLKELLSVLGIGIIAVTSIDVLGSISSRKMNFNYVYLSPFSIIVYGLIGYLTYPIATLIWALLIGCTVGIYDGTIGWRLSIILNANFGQYKEQTLKMNMTSRIVRMLFVSSFFGSIGFAIARIAS